jgi:uncharacterized protein (TIGR00661 family)
MNIIYAVAGEGMGHATRSRPVIEYLRTHHRVRVFAGGKAAKYLRRFVPVSRIASTRLVYRNNAVSIPWTFLLNLIRTPLYLFSFLKMLVVMIFSRPDVLITDFEPWSTWAALLTGVRVVSIDNENVITNARLALPKYHRWNFFKAWLVTKLLVPYAHAVIIPSFFFLPLNNNRAHYVAPIIREEIAARKPTTKKHVLVYQTSSTNMQLLNVLKQFPRQQFMVYGFPKAGIEGNLHFKHFNEQEFFDDLASAKAVIANGGFTLLSEALFFRKPILSIPIAGQCEQIINAHYLENLGYGMMTHETNFTVLKKFFNRLNGLQDAVKNLPRWHAASALKKVAEVIRKQVP